MSHADEIRQMATEVPPRSNITHESCVRSFQILEEVKQMLQRGDSQKTIRDFIDLCETPLPSPQTKDQG